MQVILLERIGRLGQMGDVVTVKDGFARTFSSPRQSAGAHLRPSRALDKERAQSSAQSPS